MSRRSVRIASLYGSEWSNLPSMKAQRRARRSKIADSPKAIKPLTNPVWTGPVWTIIIPTRGMYTYTYADQCQEADILRHFLSKYDTDASIIQRAHAITPFFEYLEKRPYFLLINPGMKATAMRKIHEFKSQIATHEARLAEYRMAAEYMRSYIHYRIWCDKGKEILENGMKIYEEEAAIWARLKVAIESLAVILA